MIKYKIHGIDLKAEENLKLIESIQIKFKKEESNDLISRHIIRSLLGKFSFTVDSDGHYKICAQNIISSWLGENKIFMYIKIETDSQEEIDVLKMVRTDDINPVSEKINKIILKSQKIIRKQSLEIQTEDESYTMQKNYTKSFIFFTVSQIIIVVVLVAYQLYSFRKYLLSNRVI